MADHPWCQNVPRDEAIRAAEDAVERPAVPDWRELPERLAALEREVARLRGTDPHPTAAREEETPTGGLRTERVTLEITRPHRPNYPASATHFLWPHILRDVVHGERESVRVVPAAEGEAEVERLRSENAGLRNSWRLSLEANYERAAERDAAIRERDAALARVAELEASAKLAPAANVGAGSNQADAEPVYLWCDYCGSSFDLRRGGSRKLVEPDNAFGPERWKNLCVGCDVDSRSQVVDQQQPAAEPVAWAVVYPNGADGVISLRKADAEHIAAEGDEVVPLYRAPPQPRGWLTEQEIAAVRFFADWKNGEVRMVEEIEQQRPILDALLARNSPPTVRLPLVQTTDNGSLLLWDGRTLMLRDKVIAALAAAGVEVEE